MNDLVSYLGELSAPCPADKSFLKRGWVNDLVSYLGESSCSTLSCSYKSLEEELGINVNDLASFLSESSVPFLAARSLWKRRYASM